MKAIQRLLSGLLVLCLLFGQGVLPVLGTTLTTETGTQVEQNTANLSQGVQNIVKRAYQMTNIKWTPKKNISGWGEGVTYRAGTTYKGLPYGQPYNGGDYVPWETGLSGFLDAVNNPDSKMYTKKITSPKVMPYYSTDCSAFVSWAWGLNSRQTTQTIHNFATKISETSYANMQVGDCLCKAGSHVVLITAIKYNASGGISAVEVSEATVGSTNYLCHSVWFGEGYEQSMSKFKSKYLDSGYILYRSKTRDSVTYTHNCDVPLQGDVCEKCFPTYSKKVNDFISDSRWKDGASWPANQAPKTATKWSSEGCCAYVADFVYYVYGYNNSPKYNTTQFTKFTNPSEIKTGDIIHTSNHWFVVLERTGDTLYTAEGNYRKTNDADCPRLVRVTKNGYKIQDGKLYFIAGKSYQTLEYGYHYNFDAASGGGGGETQKKFYFSDLPSKMSVSDTDAVIALTLNKPSGTTASKYGANLYAADGTKLGSVSDKSSGFTNSTYIDMWWTVSKSMGLTLSPGTTYQFDFWSTVDGTTYTSEKRSFTTTGKAAVPQPQNVTMSFDANGGFGEMDDMEVSVGSTITLPRNQFTRSGFAFLGWNVQRSDGKWYVAGQGWMTAAELVISDYTAKLYTDGMGNLTINDSWTKGTDGNCDFTFFAVWEEQDGNETDQFFFTDLPSRMSVSDTDAVIALKLNKPKGTTASRYGANLYNAAGTLIGSVSDKSNGYPNSTYIDLWWTVSTGMGLTLTPGTKYQFDFWVTVDGTTYTSAKRSFTTTGKGHCGENLTWTLGDDGVLVISGEGDMYDYEIAELEEIPWYHARESITAIQVEEGVTHIGSYAFAFSSAERVQLPESVQSFGDWCFTYMDCLTAISLPQDIAAISAGMFNGAARLTDVTIPGSVKTLGRYAFAECGWITELTLPEGLTEIGREAFAGTGLSEIIIPASVQTIESEAFAGCESLCQIDFQGSAPGMGDNVFSGVTAQAWYPEANPTWTSDVMLPYGGTIEWCGFGIDIIATGYCGEYLSWMIFADGTLEISGEGKMLDYMPGSTVPSWETYREYVTSVKVNEGVTHIGDNSFFLPNANTVDLPATLESIGQAAFAGCNQITDIPIPVGVTRIDDYAFITCAALAQVELPDALEEIGACAFTATAIGEITIPANVTEIGDGAFSSCPNLTAILVDENNGNFYSVDGVLYQDCDLIQVPGAYTGRLELVDDCVNIRPYAACDNKGITELVMSARINEVGDFAFSECTALKTIHFQGDMPTFGTDVFLNVTAEAYYPAANATWISSELQPCGGTITWLPRASGDINGDGKVNNRDAARLMQHLAGWDVEVAAAALDINGDGRVNNRDAARLMQYLAGWDVEIH